MEALALIPRDLSLRHSAPLSCSVCFLFRIIAMKMKAAGLLFLCCLVRLVQYVLMQEKCSMTREKTGYDFVVGRSHVALCIPGTSTWIMLTCSIFSSKLRVHLGLACELSPRVTTFEST